MRLGPGLFLLASPRETGKRMSSKSVEHRLLHREKLYDVDNLLICSSCRLSFRNSQFPSFCERLVPWFISRPLGKNMLRVFVQRQRNIIAVFPSRPRFGHPLFSHPSGLLGVLGSLDRASILLIDPQRGLVWEREPMGG